MKTLLLMIALCSATVAQDVNGVSLAGRPDNPLIVNNSDQAVIGWTILRWDADGAPLPAHRVLMSDQLLYESDPGIKPGHQSPPQNGNVIKLANRPDVAAFVQIDSVLFADGTVAGPDTMAPEFGAVDGFAGRIRDMPGTYRIPEGLIKRLPSPHKPGESPLVDFPPPQPCGNTGQCWPIANYCCDKNVSGIIFGTDYGVESPSVGGTAVCGPGSPQQGYGIGDNVNATIYCPSNPEGTAYFGSSKEATQRPDFQADRIVQRYDLYNQWNGFVQNMAKFHELCAYATLPNRGGTGPFGKAVTEYNFSFGCP